MRTDTETTCHCSADYAGSDHCPECGCEQYESGDCGYTAPAVPAWLSAAMADTGNVFSPRDTGQFHGPDERASYNGSPSGSIRMEQRLTLARDVVGLRELSRVARSVGADFIAEHLITLSEIFTDLSGRDTGRVHGPAYHEVIIHPPTDLRSVSARYTRAHHPLTIGRAV